MILSLLEKLFTNEELVEGEESDYIGLVRDVEVFAIKSQIHHYLKDRTQTERVTQLLSEQVKESSQRAAYQNLMLRHELFHLLDVFDSEAISVIPLKGVVFSEEYFGDFAARGTADIDLFIRPSELQTAIALVKEQGFTNEEEEDPTNNHCTFVKVNAGLSVSVELHWNLDKEYSSNVDPDIFWVNSEPYSDFKYVRVLSKQDTLYYTCLHAARHNMDSVKYFIDLLQIITTFPSQIDFTEIKKRAKRDKTWRKVKAVLTILYRECRFLHEIKPYRYATFVFWSLALARRTHTGKKNLAYYLYRFYFDYLLVDTPAFLITGAKWFHYINPPRMYLMYFLGEDRESISKWTLLKEYYRVMFHQPFNFKSVKSRGESS
ncbi:nucleotidyltransferase family protein [Alkalihalobacillus sp. CinArs1]|uniref:nucleotidyltransferase family protein n=1 Tax=Alkalihalobacillus sp. CinArs1 TaxID=2995314 RepID=UPI0022DD30E9|nr:nucleotidyltransferase family protein [Alkalihalobacillus sp. CinArs1]